MNEYIMDYADIIEDKAKITMMVADYTLSSNIDYRIAYALFPTVRPGLAKIKDNKSLPHFSVPGTIVSISHNGETRGYMRGEKETYFKNCTSIDVSCKEKNVNAKLYEDKIRLCGITNEEMIEEAVDYIIGYILDVQDVLTYAKENPDVRDKTIIWLKENSQGLTIRKTEKTKKKNLVVKKSYKQTLIRPISYNDIEHAPNEKIAKMYLRMLPDLTYHDDFCFMLDWVKKIEWFADSNLCKVQPFLHVKNTNSKLGFNIGLCMIFAHIFKSRFPEYAVFYDNAVKPATIEIKIPYIPTEDQLSRGKNPENCFHSFLIQRSGKITHSGPVGDENKVGYHKFIQSLRVMKTLIPKEYPQVLSYLQQNFSLF
jgi:hypothetical protein